MIFKILNYILNVIQNFKIEKYRLLFFWSAQDQKNYHAWQHRQWVLATFKLFANELAFIDRLLTDDIRFWPFIVFWTYDIIAQKQLCVESTLFRQLQNRGLGQGGGGKGGACSTLDLSNLMEIQIYQVKFSLEKIQLVKRNESAWNYLRVSNCA